MPPIQAKSSREARSRNGFRNVVLSYLRKDRLGARGHGAAAWRIVVALAAPVGFVSQNFILPRPNCRDQMTANDVQSHLGKPAARVKGDGRAVLRLRRRTRPRLARAAPSKASEAGSGTTENSTVV